MAVFLGREREIALLERKLDEAFAGSGGVVVLAGEPGIGKTATIRHFGAYAEGRGATVLSGSSFEGEGQPPFAPWAAILNAYVRSAAREHVREALAGADPSVTQLIDQIPGVAAGARIPAPLSAEQERLRLYDAVARLLLSIAADSPVVLTLDDLHWADRDSLAVLRYVARVAADSPLLLIGTYRKTEVHLDPAHALTDVLAALPREANFESIVLSGLARSEVAEFLRSDASEDVAASISRAIYEETGGNPFYVRELWRHVREEGLVDALGVERVGVPESVRHVIGRRLQRLSDEAIEALRIACLFTSGFDFPVIQEVSGLDEDVLLDAVDEALRAGFIQTRADAASTYDFSHALVRHALAEDLNPDRRARLHRRIALALEQIYAGHEREHAAELAAQYHASRSLPDADRGRVHALHAAERARVVAAHEQGAAFLRIARDLTPSSEPQVRSEIICELALGEAEALLLEQATASIEQALAAFAELDTDPEEVAGFLARVCTKLKEGGAERQAWHPLVTRGLSLLGDRRGLTWARLTLLLDPVEQLHAGDINISRWLGRDADAFAIARHGGDEEDYAMTLEPYEWRDPEETERVLALARTWRKPAAVIRAYDAVVRDLLHRHHDTTGALEPLEEMLVVARRNGSIVGQVEALIQLSFCRGLLGDIDGQEDVLRQAQQLVDRLGPTHRLRAVVESGGVPILGFLRGEADWARQGALAEAFVARPETGATPLGFVFGFLSVIDHAFAGNADRCRELIDRMTPLLERVGPTHYHKVMNVDLGGWALWELGESRHAAAYRRMTFEMIDAGVGGPLIGAHELTIARMAALRDDYEEAKEYFRRARDTLEARGKAPIRALVDLDEAVALRRSAGAPRERVVSLLETAAASFRRLGMTGWGRRANAIRAELDPYSLPGGLTPREAEVLRLLATGRSNKEMADSLFVSLATVERHLANIYRKLGVRSRVEAAGFALSHNLVERSTTSST